MRVRIGGLLRQIYDIVVRDIVFIVFLTIMQAATIAMTTVGKAEFAVSPTLMMIGSFKAFSIALIFTLLSFGKRWLRILFLLINLLLVEVYLLLVYQFNTHITPRVIMLVMQTNAKETEGFFSAFFNWRLSLTMVGIATIIITSYLLIQKWWRSRWQRYVYSNRSICNVAGCVVIVLFILSLSSNLLKQKMYTNLNGLKENLIASISYNQLPHREIYDSYMDLLKLSDSVKNIIKGNESIRIDACRFESPHIVFILGESHIKNHDSLYGYKHETNPNLTKELDEGRLFVFNDVISKYRYTNNCNLVIYPLFDLNEHKIPDNVPLFPAVMKKAGYKVYMIDGQAKKLDGGNKMADKFFLNPDEVHNQCFDYRNDQVFRYDHQLIDFWFGNVYSDSIYNNSEHTLTIFHLQGQHFDAKLRYPHTTEFDYFTSDSIRRTDQGITQTNKAKIAEYDNATRYLDNVLYKIIDQFKDKDAIIVYTSDHGECLFDDVNLTYSRPLGEEFSIGALKMLHDVPFYIWCSDTYKSRHPEIIDKIRGAINTPFYNSYVSQILFGLAGIQSNYTDNKKNPLSNEFVVKNRLIYNGGSHFDYDAKRSLLESVEIMTNYN